MKIISWNVNGIRAWSKKDGCLNWVLENQPDFFCVQETKAQEDQLSDDIKKLPNYFSYFESSKERKGHSGVAIYTKLKPEKVSFGLGVKDLDQQGRQINLFYKDFVIINCYFPNGGGPAERLQFKLKYYKEFLNFILKIKKSGKKVIFCGDVNVAHKEIDLARPENNKNSVGFLPEERVWIDKFISSGFVDVYRKLNPEKIKYSWWDMKTFSRDRNVGWRIDYFFVDEKIFNKISDVEIFDNVFGSDHAPIYLNIKI
ncbi:MAG TPA: exodeoxyribonuclease III [Candidatus Paceibacterota bacterium]|nr:exodeoxyribonuclease III [Candidatus Paceibacterota bacterium]HMP19014.1 exodeoxyribonuclease III [Candidatus Paceibacterota bacterium]HMP85546.1 exodeoxyribonuclease III [Candidatus Paceibacterota bacterium]